MAFYGVAKRIVQVVLWPFYKVEAEYRAELPQNKGYIMASNHVSDMDPVMLGLAFHKQLRFMAKEELFKIPVLGRIIRALGAFHTGCRPEADRRPSWRPRPLRPILNDAAFRP